jgi:hypothetical protein
LSAKHGLVAPDDGLERYDETMNDKSAAARREWAAIVLRQLELLVKFPGNVFEIHAGAAYRKFGLVNGLRDRGAIVEIPAEHLGQGEQLAFYLRPQVAAVAVRLGRSSDLLAKPSVMRGSYVPRAEHLRGLASSHVQLSFSQVEYILGRSLPASAHRHRAWWAHDGMHRHAAAWMRVTWLVHSVDPNAATVSFRRGKR